MKLTILILLTFFTLTTTSAQTDKADIQKTLEVYLKAVEQKDYTTVVDYLYPKLFNIAPKKMMLQAMAEMSNDTNITITMHSSIIKNISKTYLLDNVKYLLVKYSFKMTMLLKNNISDANVRDDGSMDVADFTYKLMKGKYGEHNITFDKAKSEIEIFINNEMYAINDPAYPGWKFLEKKDEMQPLLQQILPKKVLKKF